ncbi:hypothetical protein J5N97_019464 [Dioscorea zingiberensis]|uniref:Uncharacterized protein n=1 Tax=Dioscorea zingiberensis TaxID=325984 RepID=A0A9D5HCQ3_9LILI|nr:hypothetical protein J5N97_019464 [Dioscorea zingiberensis]
MEVGEPKPVSGGEPEAEVEILHSDNGFVHEVPEEKGRSEEDADAIEALQQEIQGLRTDRSELQRWKDEMQAEMERSETEKKALAAHAAYLEGEISRLQHDLVTAESSGADSEAEAQDLRKALTDLQAEKALLADSKVSLEARIGDLESKISALSEQREEAAAALSEKEAQIVALKKEMDALELKGRALEDGFQLSKSKARDDLEQEVKRKEELEKAVKELEEENSRLQGRIHDLQSESEKRGLLINGNKEEDMVVGVREGLRVSWAVAAAAAASTGTVAATAMAFYLRHARQR